MKKVLLFLILLIAVSCSNDDDYTPILQHVDGDELLTGSLGVNSTSGNAFGFEIDGLTIQEISQFASGNSLFNQSWVSAPASTTARDGLGPTFNARACAGCHFKDGRGKPHFNGELSSGFLMRVSENGLDAMRNPIPVAGYGNQIQDRSNNGILTEASVIVTYQSINGVYPDGTTYELQQPTYSFINENFGSLSGVQTSPRVGQQTIGLGLISALSDLEILSRTDELDIDQDGISGKANFVWNIEENNFTIGKYGWKANAPTLKQQIAGAFHGDMGLTSSLFNQENCPSVQQDCLTSPNGGTPEVTDTQLDRVVFYQGMIAVPNRRNFLDEDVLKGRSIFNSSDCIKCHATNLQTSSSDIHPFLENVTISPYSDFLLHDMGDLLADNRPDGLATGNEWRTQPLWGIGLIPTVNGHTNLLHDGRARNIEEAILWHGGEATNAVNNFKELPVEDRNALIKFIESL